MRNSEKNRTCIGALSRDGAPFVILFDSCNTRPQKHFIFLLVKSITPSVGR